MEHFILVLLILFSVFWDHLPIYYKQIIPINLSKPQDWNVPHDLSIGTRRSSWRVIHEGHWGKRQKVMLPSLSHHLSSPKPPPPTSSGLLLALKALFVHIFIIWLFLHVTVPSCDRAEEMLLYSDMQQNILHVCQYLHLTWHWHPNIYHTGT